MSDLEKTLKCVDANLDASLDRLFELLRIESISTDPAFKDECRKAGQFLVDALNDIGFEASLRDTPGHPMVVGHHDGPAGTPHVLFYGHYDVQPVDPLELWDTPPFEPTVKEVDGAKRFYCRGSSDDKGQLMTFVEACRAWKDATGALPCKVTILFEGEEESGSPSLAVFLDSAVDELSCDLALVCDTSMWDANTPAITTALRGMSSDEVTIHAASRDLHSGYYGGAAQNPIHILSKILAEMHDESGTIARTLLFSIIQPFGTLWFIYMLPVFFVVTKLFRSKPWHLFGFAILLQVIPINTEAIWVEIIGLCGVVGIDNHWVLVDEFCSFFVYFLAGYLFAPKLFALAQYAQANSGKALGLLTAWFLINLGLVYAGLAGLPVVSLLLGGVGAVAIVVAASLLARFAAGSALSHLGARSIVVYLAFFIPMVVARLAFTKLVPGLDAGTMAALSTLFAVVAPLIGYAVINRIGVGHFLFTRPDWAKLTGTFRGRAPSIQPAE